MCFFKIGLVVAFIWLLFCTCFLCIGIDEFEIGNCPSNTICFKTAHDDCVESTMVLAKRDAAAVREELLKARDVNMTLLYQTLHKPRTIEKLSAQREMVQSLGQRPALQKVDSLNKALNALDDTLSEPRFQNEAYVPLNGQKIICNCGSDKCSR